jgi:hypothetical protein
MSHGGQSSEQVDRGEMSCAKAFLVARKLSAAPLEVGRAATELGIRLKSCQLGLFRDEEGQRSVSPAATVEPELEGAIREGLVLGRLPCAVAWALATRFGIKKTAVADAAEKLDIRISQCQLGAF